VSDCEVEHWLRASLPKQWLEFVEQGRSPGSPDLYDEFDEVAWLKSLFSTRYLMAAWPVEFGGLGWDGPKALEGLDALARYEVPLPLYVTSLLLAGSGLLEYGSDEQRSRFLPKISSAEEIWC